MIKVFGAGFAAILGIAAVLSLCFGLTWLGIEWRGFFGPKKADVERSIFERTESYQHSKRQDLIRYRMQYLSTDDEDAKALIASTVRLQFAEFDANTLSPELRQFWAQCNRR